MYFYLLLKFVQAKLKPKVIFWFNLIKEDQNKLKHSCESHFKVLRNLGFNVFSFDQKREICKFLPFKWYYPFLSGISMLHEYKN